MTVAYLDYSKEEVAFWRGLDTLVKNLDTDSLMTTECPICLAGSLIIQSSKIRRVSGNATDSLSPKVDTRSRSRSRPAFTFAIDLKEWTGTLDVPITIRCSPYWLWGTLACTMPLTTFGNTSPRNACAAKFAAVSRNFVTAGTLHDAMCEARMTFSIFNTG